MSPLTWDQPYHAGALQLGRWEQPYHRVKETLIHGGIYKSCVIPYKRTSNENISGEIIQLKVKAFSVSTMLGVGTRVPEAPEEETQVLPAGCHKVIGITACSMGNSYGRTRVAPACKELSCIGSGGSTHTLSCSVGSSAHR